MSSYFESRIDNLFEQLLTEHPAFNLFVTSNPWLRELAIELQRKYRWTLTSSYSNHAHPPLEPGLTTALSFEMVAYTLEGVIEALRPTSKE